MDTDDCLADGRSAMSLADERLPGWERRFRAATKHLADLLAEAKREFPDAAYFTGSGGLHLILGGEGTPDAKHLCAYAAHPNLNIGDGDW